MKQRILVVEDEQKLARLLSLELEHEGYEVVCAHDGKEGLDYALKENFCLIVLDIMLPSLNGIEVLRRLRAEKNTPVIILTARDELQDKVSGLDLGANDYMTKPFATEELLARIRANIKKGQPAKLYTHKDLVIDVTSRLVTYRGKTIDLTKKEFDLLLFLMENKNMVISREKILDTVWGYDYHGNTNVADVYVRYLRSKIDEKFEVNLIETVRGAGYIIRN
ncbi:MAG: response regulator transcription factor [Firmicutes bacterium]|nr:response regulator transcription factor [Bacillota bacterium]